MTNHMEMKNNHHHHDQIMKILFNFSFVLSGGPSYYSFIHDIFFQRGKYKQYKN